MPVRAADVHLQAGAQLSRPKHPIKELETVLKEAEAKGWRVEKGKKYFKIWCPKRCGKHWKTVKLTPSGGTYLQNLIGQLQRATCWGDEELRP
jgi:hypothetical protein